MRISFFVSALVLVVFSLSVAAVPQTISYQGHLASSGGAPVNAAVDMTFTIYNAATNGANLWTEGQAVQVNNGIYAVALGAINPMNPAIIDGDLWLGVKVGTDAEMTPRQKLNSVPFALRAADVDGLAALEAQISTMQEQLNSLEIISDLIIDDPSIEYMTPSGSSPDICMSLDQKTGNYSVSWQIVGSPAGSNPVLDSQYGCGTSFYPDVGGEYTLRAAINDGANIVEKDFFYRILGNFPIAISDSYEGTPVIAEDGTGGAFIVWEGDTSLRDIFIQRIDSNGKKVWAEDLKVCDAATIQNSPRILPDGNGGAFIVWHDRRNGLGADLYAQRVDINGNFLWANNGIPVVVEAGNQSNVDIVQDGTGGIIAAWEDYRFGSDYFVFAQRINSSGIPQWTANGVQVQTGSTIALDGIDLIPDAAGGGIILWNDSTNWATSNYDINAQRIDFNGNVLWGSNGKPVVSETGNQENFVAVSDGSGGAYLAWRDTKLYIQRIDSSGDPMWVSPGIIASDYYSYELDLTAGGVGTVFLSWRDARNSSNNEIYIQKFDASGAAFWGNYGKRVTNKDGYESNPISFYDDSKGLYVLWFDYRQETSNRDIYAQRLSDDGTFHWRANGIPVATATGDQTIGHDPNLEGSIVTDNLGGFFVPFTDTRTPGNNSDVYAQRVKFDGSYAY